MVETFYCCPHFALLLVAVTLPAVPCLLEPPFTYIVDDPTTLDPRPFSATLLQNGPDQLGFWTEETKFSTEPCGPHVGAPVRFARGKWAMDAFPLGELWPVPGLSQETVMWLTTQSVRRAHSAGVVDVENSTHTEARPAQCSVSMHAMKDAANLPQLATPSFLVDVMSLMGGGGSVTPEGLDEPGTLVVPDQHD
ncbi:uncharacterized protein LOC126996692 isoform X2 [Eriocheir sinensis]|nr:uncharacterized protein LOC126996692 isoform X2 [Eriocheir sinensis]